MGSCVSVRPEEQHKTSFHSPQKSPQKSPKKRKKSVIENIKNLKNSSLEQEDKKEQFAQSLISHQNEQDEYNYLSKMTHFDEETLRLLHVRFNEIDSSIERDARISLEEFAKILEMAPKSILVRRFFKYMDSHNLGLTFRTFATTMSILSKEAAAMEKIKLSFSLYDLNDDGFIDKNELKDVINDCLDELMPLILNNDTIDKIIQNTFQQIKCNKDDEKISFDEYCNFVSHENNKRILEPFYVDINKLIEYEAESRRLKRYSDETMQAKILHHGPLDMGNNKTFREYLPSIDFGTIERVQSIHDAWDICADIDDE